MSSGEGKCDWNFIRYGKNPVSDFRVKPITILLKSCVTLVHNRYKTLREDFPMLDAFLHGFVSGASRKLGEKAGEKAVDIVIEGFGNFGQSRNKEEFHLKQAPYGSPLPKRSKPTVLRLD